MAESRALQRLYLSKSDKEDSNIYIDTVCLPQHQYDGIRFLYWQYKKGKAGVILNDPPGYGKRVQTVLFLSAMHPVMTLPTLVLCAEGIEEVWTQQFRQWTNMGTEVSVQKDNQYTKSKCVIGTISQTNALCRREWGILVVDDNNVSREVLRAGISAKYRIWLTSFDMKKYLQTFSLIYRWLYPRDKFNVEDFQADNKKPTALLTNSVKLDAFMEDIVIRRRDVALPLGKPSHTPDRQVSRKNKDATGKKIKRSKRLPDTKHDTSTESQGTGSEHNTSAESDKNGEVKDKKESSEDFVVNIGSEEEKKDKTKMFEDNTDGKLTDVTSNSNKVTNDPIIKSGDNDIPKNPIEEMDADCNADNNDVPKSDAPKSDTQDNRFTLLISDNIDSQSIIIKYDSETQDNDIVNDIPAKKSKITNEISVSEDLFSTSSESKSDKVNNHDINVNNHKTSETLFSTDLPNEVNNEHEIKTDDLNFCKDELVNKNNVSESMRLILN